MHLCHISFVGDNSGKRSSLIQDSVVYIQGRSRWIVQKPPMSLWDRRAPTEFGVVHFFFPKCVPRFCMWFSRVWYSWKRKSRQLTCTWKRCQLCTYRPGTILTITRNSSLESMPPNSLLTTLHIKSYMWQVRLFIYFWFTNSLFISYCLIFSAVL